jgi:hypothetical protein
VLNNYSWEENEFVELKKYIHDGNKNNKELFDNIIMRIKQQIHDMNTLDKIEYFSAKDIDDETDVHNCYLNCDKLIRILNSHILNIDTEISKLLKDISNKKIFVLDNTKRKLQHVHKIINDPNDNMPFLKDKIEIIINNFKVQDITPALDAVSDMYIYVYNSLLYIFKQDTYITSEIRNKNLQTLKKLLTENRNDIVGAIHEFKRSKKLRCGFNGPNDSIKIDINKFFSYLREIYEMSELD